MVGGQYGVWIVIIQHTQLFVPRSITLASCFRRREEYISRGYEPRWWSKEIIPLGSARYWYYFYFFYAMTTHSHMFILFALQLPIHITQLSFPEVRVT
jgi:hypothetical protein